VSEYGLSQVVVIDTGKLRIFGLKIPLGAISGT